MDVKEIISLISDVCAIIAFFVSLLVADGVRKILKNKQEFKGKAKNNSNVNQAGRDINIGG